MEEQQDKQEQKPVDRVTVKDVSGDKAPSEKAKGLKFTKSFFLEYVDDAGESWNGTFTVKRLTLGESAQVGVLRARMMADATIDAMDTYTLTLLDWIAWSKVGVVDAPDWFNPDDAYDAAVLQRVVKEGRAFEASFRKPRVG
jgi:hypothetical protein